MSTSYTLVCLTATKNAERYWMMTRLVGQLIIPVLRQLDNAKKNPFYAYIITSSTPGQRCLAECGMRVKQVHEQHTCSARGGGETAEVLVRKVLHGWKEKEGRLLRLREAGQGCPSPGGG